MRTVEQIGDPSRFCTVNQHRELARQALDVAVWNAAMWEPAPTTPEEAPATPADQQGELL